MPSPDAGTKVSDDDHLWLRAALPERMRRLLLDRGVERSFAADEVIYLAGAAAGRMYLVLDGRVRLLRGRDGNPILIHEEIAGGCIGEVPLFEGTTYPATAICAEPTRCLVLERSFILDMVRAEPELALALLQRLAARVRHLVERLDRNSAQSTLARLAQLILARADGKRSFTLGITQQQAAEEIGTVRELVVRGLRTLRDRGIIEAKGGGRYVVRDLGALREAAE